LSFVRLFRGDPKAYAKQRSKFGRESRLRLT